MAHGKGRGARDLLYGRRGGHWVDQGHVPGSGAADIAKIRQRTRAAHERDPDKNSGWPDLELLDRAGHFAPTTPDEWAGRSRMAAARRSAGVTLDSVDLQALTRSERTAA